MAARTYVLRLKATAAAGAISDTCDSTACQVYRGAAEWTASGSSVQREWASSTAAVAATSGVALTYGGAWILGEFSSSNGGQTVASSLAYQTSKADPYDGVPSGSTADVDQDHLAEHHRERLPGHRQPSGACGSTPATASRCGAGGSPP